jgi:hypothetical protein
VGFIVVIFSVFFLLISSIAQDILRVIEEDFGKPLHEIFSSFNAVPLAAASLSQVHHARMLDGREVVVKVWLSLWLPFNLVLLTRIVTGPVPQQQGADDGRSSHQRHLCPVRAVWVLADLSGLTDSLSRLFQKHMAKMSEELERQFITEFDFRTEAANLASVRSSKISLRGVCVCAYCADNRADSE